MAARLQRPGLLSSRSSNPCLPRRSVVTFISCKKALSLEHLSNCWSNPRSVLFVRYGILEKSKNCLNRQSFNKKKSRRLVLACAEDGVAINGSLQPTSSNNLGDLRTNFTGPLQDGNNSNGLIQSLHDAARTIELAFKDKITPSRFSWFPATWLGADKNAWVKTLSYQASLYSLLQAVYEISSRGNYRDDDINVFVQRSLSRQAALLENTMRDSLSSKYPKAYEWFWSEQVPSMMTSFVNYIEGDHRFVAATSVYAKGKSTATSNEIEVSLLMLVLNCIAAITKVGPTKFCCPPFFSIIPDTTGRMMEKLVDFVSLPQAYHSIKSIGLQREFLTHFGPRAAVCRVNGDIASDEVVFWVDLIQKQLQRAIDREKIWSKLTTSESIEVLERDLAIFGFFIALGRSTQSILAANGFDSLENPLEDLVRHLIGGSVLYYPQLSAISSYQLYVEVVCEELEWIPFYPNNAGTQPPKQSHGHKSKPERPPNYEVIPQLLDVCSYWLQSFIKYSKWPENPSNVKAAKFLSKGHKSLIRCKEELGILKNASSIVEESNSFDKALESVDEALARLESLLQELYVSNSSSGKEDIKAACSDLEKIRKLKKEAEFLEATFRAKAGSLQQGGDKNDSDESFEVQKRYLKGRDAKKAISSGDQGKSRGFWGFFVRPPKGKHDPELSRDESFGKSSRNLLSIDSDPYEVSRFEILRNELIELENRVKRSTDQSADEEEKMFEDPPQSSSKMESVQLVQIPKTDSIIERTLQKLRETTTDVWQGTQLLAIDSAAALQLLRRSLIGDELTEKEKKALRRTMTDLASVIPIGILMLLPVTAVGHAAMLAGIQRYVPGLIPSTYGSERLNLLRQIEKMKELQTNEIETEEGVEEIAL